MLRQRQQRNSASTAKLHGLASQWYEDNGLEIDAFHHAAAANDIERAERLIDGKGMPLYFRGAMAPFIRWLESLPAPVLDARPSLWVTYASSWEMRAEALREIPMQTLGQVHNPRKKSHRSVLEKPAF